MDGLNYYERLEQTQRSIEERAGQWQAQLRWTADVQSALALRAQDNQSKDLTSPVSGILQDRLTHRRDGQHILGTLPIHASPLGARP